MERTPELVAAVSAWRQVATTILRSTETIAPMTTMEFAVEPSVGNDIDAQIDTLLRHANEVIAELRTPMEAGDTEARTGVLKFFVGNLSVADAVISSADEPSTAAAKLHVMSIASFPLSFWENDIDDAVASLLTPVVSGGQDDASGELSKAIEQLESAAGAELVGLVTDGVLAVAFPQLTNGVNVILAGTAKSVFDKAVDTSTHWWNVIKKAATKVVAWVVAHALDLVPSALRASVSAIVDKLAGDLKTNVQAKIPQFVGEVAGRLLGADDVTKAWGTATPDGIASAISQLPHATQSELARIGTVSKVRAFLEKWSSAIASAVVAAPEVALGVAAAAAAAMIFVLVELWEGLKALKQLVQPAGPAPMLAMA